MEPIELFCYKDSSRYMALVHDCMLLGGTGHDPELHVTGLAETATSKFLYMGSSQNSGPLEVIDYITAPNM